MATARLSFTFFCPMNSCSLRGRSFSSNDASSSTIPADTTRSRISDVVLGLGTGGDSKAKFLTTQSADFAERKFFTSRGLTSPAYLSDHMMFSQLVALIGRMNQSKTVGALLGDCRCHIKVAKRRHQFPARAA